MRNKMFRSIVCLLLVLQCVCTPLAQAAESNAAVQPTFYAASGSANAAVVASGFMRAAAYSSYDIDNDVYVTALDASVTSTGGSHYEKLGGGYGFPNVKRVAIESNQESETALEIDVQRTYDVETETTIPEYGVFRITAGSHILTMSELRVPDYEFEEWYVYSGTGTLFGETELWDGAKDWNDMVLLRQSEGNPLKEITLQDALGLTEPVKELPVDMVITVKEDTAKDILVNLVRNPGSGKTYYATAAFPIVGGWLKSSKAYITDTPTATDSDGGELTLYHYDENSATDSLGDLTPIEAFDSDDIEFFLRVGEDVDTLTLDLSVVEPYIDFQLGLVDGDMTSDTDQVFVSKSSETDALETTTSTYEFKEKLDVTAETPPVSVLVNSSSSADGMKIKYTALNDGKYTTIVDVGGVIESETWTTENSVDTPASSEWLIEDIPLKHATDESLETTSGCNVIEVTVTAPDGETKKVYTFYVQRLSEPTFDLEPGNTPAGMIARESDDRWGDSSKPEQVASNKQEWLVYFTNKNKTNPRTMRTSISNPSYYIRSDLNNGGAIFDGMLSDNVWRYDVNGDDHVDTLDNVDYDGDGLDDTYDDIDLDPTALVVYQNYDFNDPGFTVTMSNAQEFDGSAGKLERRIRFDVPAEGASMLDALFNENTQSMYYVGGKLVPAATEPNEGWETFEQGTNDFTEIISIAGEKILPGVYSIEYRFTGAHTNEVYPFSRPLVVLAIPGDVDMDGVTTVADSFALYKLLYTDAAFTETTMTPRETLFAWTVCNVYNTVAMTIDNDDIELLRSGWRPQLAVSRPPASLSTTQPISVSDYRYVPLRDMDERYEFKRVTEAELAVSTSPTVSIESTKAPLLSEVVANETASVLASSPTDEFASALALYNTLTAEDGVAAGDVFFVDVKLGDLTGVSTDSLNGAVESFTHALAYDARYVRPATMADMIGKTEKPDGTAGNVYAEFSNSNTYEDELSAWQAVIARYNLDSGSGTIWSGKSYTVTAATQPAREYTEHFSQVLTGFEEELAGKTVSSIDTANLALKEMTFSIRSTDADTISFTGVAADSVILRVPFYMHTYPIGAGEAMNFVSLNFGMQETTIVTTNKDGDMLVSAYSAQKEIYADKTANLVTVFTYGSEETAAETLLAPDNTPRHLLGNAYTDDDGVRHTDTVYGEMYEYAGTPLVSGEIIDGELPEGLAYDHTNLKITGTPKESGSFPFTIQTYSHEIFYYQIVVEQRQLRIYPIGGTSYYGEADYTTAGYKTNILDKAVVSDGEYNDGAANFDYQLAYGYYPEDIDELDTDASPNVKNDGSMESLPYIISVRDGAKDFDFVHPTLTSNRYHEVDKETGSANISPAGGSYKATIDEENPGSTTNYRFVIVDRDPNGEDKSTITVLPRPITATISGDNYEKIIYTGSEPTNKTEADESKLERYTLFDRSDPVIGERRVAVLTGEFVDDVKRQFNASAMTHSESGTVKDGRAIYGDLPISKDVGILPHDTLRISYGARYEQTADDLSGAPLRNFDIPENGFGWRDVTLSTVKLEEVGSYSNYMFGLEEDATFTITNGGLVENVSAQSVQANWDDVIIEIDYGGTLLVLNRLLARVYYGKDYEDESNAVTYGGKDKDGRDYFEVNDMYVSLITGTRKTWEEQQLGNSNVVGIGFDDDTPPTPVEGVKYWDKTQGVGVIQETFDQNEILESTEDDPQSYYLRVAYAQNVDGELVIYKTAYSEKITVNKKTVLLRADEIQRYYGENVEETFMLRLQDLASHDQTGLKGDAEGWIDGAVLADLLEDDYTPPTLVATYTGSPDQQERPLPESVEVFQDALSSGTAIDEKSPFYGVDFYIGIYGAKAKNYKFEYVQRSSHGTERSSDFGYSTGYIHRRPIVLESLGDSMITEYYSDVSNLKINGLTRDTAAVTEDYPAGGVTFALAGSKAGDNYYQLDWYDVWMETGQAPSALKLKYPLNGKAIVEGDVLGITFDVEILPENIMWRTYADSYFDKGTDKAHVKLNGFDLDRSQNDDKTYKYPAANNYELVFKSTSDAMSKTTTKHDTYIRTSDGSEYTYTLGTGGNSIFYVVGHVKLMERPIIGLEVYSDKQPNLLYTHGDTFNPVDLTVDITYEALEERGGGFDMSIASFDNAKVIDEDTVRLSYSYDSTSGNSSFGNYRLSMKIDDEVVDRGFYLTHADHDGKPITVIYDDGEGNTVSGTSSYTITVGRRKLTLNVVDQYRYYGESNYSVRFRKGTDNAPGDAIYEYYFDINELAYPDLEKVEKAGAFIAETTSVGTQRLGYGYVTSGTTADVNPTFAAFDADYTAPTFHTAASAASPKSTDGYSLTLSGAELSNYEIVVAAEGRVRVYPRPIVVNNIYGGYTGDDATDRSIYSIFSGAKDGTFFRTLPYRESASEYSAPENTTFYDYENQPITDGSLIQPNYTTGKPISGWQWFGTASAATFDSSNTGATARYQAPSGYSFPSYAAFYLTSTGIIGDDNPSFDTEIVVSTAEESGKPTAASATVQNISVDVDGGRDYENYLLVGKYVESELPARAEKRTIQSMSIFAVPSTKFNSYAYKDTLNLYGLIVKLDYSRSENETGTNTTTLVQYSNFSMYGVYVNYYPDDEVLASDATDYTTIRNNYRTAASGNHLTIAPVHDDASYADKPEGWEYGSFAHHGKYLLVTAVNFDEDNNVDTEAQVEPAFVRGAADGSVTPNPVQQINVKPHVINYELAASDKDYDGTTQGVGTIRFIDVYSDANVTDLVYAVTGRTDYEGSWKWYEGNTAGSAAAKQRTALQTIADDDYTFTSGNVSTKAGDINNSLTFTHKDGWNAADTLRFEFVDEDVFYNSDDDAEKDATSGRWDAWGDPAAMNVEVTGIILGGPDAANYTFTAVNAGVTPVHEISVTETVNPTSEAIPTATITRAERAAFDTASLGVPQLEIDDKTGVVRLLYNSKADEVVKSVSEISAEERESRTGVASSDNYDSELHIEYAIEYFLPENDRADGLTLADRMEYRSANSYLDGGAYWQDTYYFGGEAVSDIYGDGLSPIAPAGSGKFHASEDGYLGEEVEPEQYTQDSELIGQHYRWTTYDARINPGATTVYSFEGAAETVPLIQYLEMDENENLIPREDKWHFDEGFTFTVADTNTEARVVEIDGRSYYYFYGYYTTDRDPIPRGAYVLGKVRVAPTHNYNASDELYSCGGYDITEAEFSTLTASADAYADSYNQYISAVAETEREEQTAPIPRTDVLRMYEYRLDLRYAEDKESVDDTGTLYDFRVLRAVQFTDYLIYSDQQQLKVVTFDDVSSHYSGFFWDDRYQNALEFEPALTLGVEMKLPVEREQPDGSTVTSEESFNGGNTIPIYVEVGSDNNLIPERWIDILLDVLEFYEDDDPFDLSTLEVVFYPPRHHRLELKWTSSNDSVVRVTADGMLVIVGPGTATLTATSFFGKTDTITVIVHEREEDDGESGGAARQTGIFNHELLAAFLGLDSDYFFYPEREMTRGELVMVAALFFIANDSWERQEAIAFRDIVGNEPYAEAVALLSEWGVIVGVGGDMFAGERIATRAEAAAILGRMLGVEPADYVGKPTFIDSTVEDTWAAGYIAALRALGATNGIGNNLFAPNRNITRAETAAMFTRLLNNQTPTPPVTIPVDVAEDHWAFGHIVRAVNNVILPAEFEDDADSSTEE